MAEQNITEVPKTDVFTFIEQSGYVPHQWFIDWAMPVTLLILGIFGLYIWKRSRGPK